MHIDVILGTRKYQINVGSYLSNIYFLISSNKEKKIVFFFLLMSKCLDVYRCLFFFNILFSNNRKLNKLKKNHHHWKWQDFQFHILVIFYLVPVNILLFSWLIHESLIILFWIRMSIMFRICARFIMNIFHGFSWKCLLNLNKSIRNDDFHDRISNILEHMFHQPFHRLYE
jgi:hypothetical protein